MTRVEEIEKAVLALAPEELAEFRAWFEDLNARLWDERIERDARAGKCDWLARKAAEAYKAGRCKEL